MGAFKYIKKIANFYGRGKHKYIYKGMKVTKTSPKTVHGGMPLKEFEAFLKKAKGTNPGAELYGGTKVGKVTRSKSKLIRIRKKR